MNRIDLLGLVQFQLLISSVGRRWLNFVKPYCRRLGHHFAVARPTAILDRESVRESVSGPGTDGAWLGLRNDTVQIEVRRCLTSFVASHGLLVFKCVLALSLLPGCLSIRAACGEESSILDVELEVDFGPDQGQNLGTLFEAYDAHGNVVAGAGFVGAYNTQPRSDRARLHFFLKPKRVRHDVQTLPRIANNQTGVYLSELEHQLTAQARNGRDGRVYVFDGVQNQWVINEGAKFFETEVAGKSLHVSDRDVVFGGRSVLTLDPKEPAFRLRENYYAAGQMVLRVQAAEASDASNRLVACPWSPDSPPAKIDLAACSSLTMRSHQEFVYAFGQLGHEVLAATNTGGVYVLGTDGWRVLVEPGPHSYQVYSMLNYYDRLLLGHYPTGELYEYDGQTLRHLPGWPPVMLGVSKRAREAQTMTLYGGDLYVGVWPWGEVWRYDRNQSRWDFVQRMFTHPELTDDVVHPYETEAQTRDAVLNMWGQRVTSLVPLDDSLFVATSSKAGGEFTEEFDFLADGRWQDYGKVYQLTLPGQLSAVLDWTDRPTRVRLTLTDREMIIRQDGQVKAKRAVDAKAVLIGTPDRVVWGRGAYGRLAGELRSHRANVDRPFLGAYLNFSQLFATASTTVERESAIDDAIERFHRSGLNVVMPYVTSTNGTAAYPSKQITQHQFGDEDPLAYLIRSAHARGLDVYPVFCTLACGHDKPAGVLREHPDWALRTPDGEPMGHICPARAQARQWVTSVVMEVVERYQPDGILLDYLRYYNRPTRLDARSEAEFQRFRLSHPNVDDGMLEQQFREASLTQLTQQISRAVRAARPDLQIAIYSWGPHVASGHRVAQPWPQWSEAGDIDMVNISGYCYPDNYGDKYLEVFRRRLADAVELNRQHAGRATVTFCLGVATSHGSIAAASWIGDYLTRAAEEGVSGTAFFTWSRLLPFLDDVVDQEFIAQFAAKIEEH